MKQQEEELSQTEQNFITVHLTCKKEENSVVFAIGCFSPHGSDTTVSLLWRNNNWTISNLTHTAAGQETLLHLVQFCICSIVQSTL